MAGTDTCHRGASVRTPGFWHTGEMMGEVNKKAIFKVWEETQGLPLDAEVLRDGQGLKRPAGVRVEVY